MRIARIDFEGTRDGYHATARRDGTNIQIAIVTPQEPNGIEYTVAATDEQKLFQVAMAIQSYMDGYRGTNGDINEYYNELQRLA